MKENVCWCDCGNMITTDDLVKVIPEGEQCEYVASSSGNIKVYKCPKCGLEIIE